MRIRLPFAGVFTLLLLLTSYLLLSTLDNNYPSSLPPPNPLPDKLLHLFAFFCLTIAFYWVIDTTRRRTLNLTLLVCTAGLGVGSEILQSLLATAPDGSGHEFDLLNVVSNLAGSLLGLALCTWYHKRMLERRRTRRYAPVPGEDVEGGNPEEDLELGEGVGLSSRQEEGVVSGDSSVGATAAATATATTLEEEVDNWDENAEDPWDEEEDDLAGDIGVSAGPHGAATDPNIAESAAKKRTD